MRYISFDIDGLVNNYPFTMFSFAKKKYGIESSSKLELLEQLSLLNLTYSDFKYEYRINHECIISVNSFENPNLEFMQFYNLIRKISDVKIVFRTSRPEKIYPGTLERTRLSLLNLGINDPIVLPKSKESFEMFDPIFHIDDEIDHLLDHRAYTSVDKLFLYDKKSSKQIRDCGFNIVHNLNDLLKIV